MSSDSNKPKKLIGVPDETQAALIVNALSKNGIEATATGDYTSGFRAEAPGDVSVVVHQSDLARARQVLANIKRQNADIDWSQVDVGEPDDAEDS